MKILSKFFPSPNYLNIPCFGVYISDTSIKYVQVDSNGFFDNLGKFGVINLEEGLVINGEIKNPIKIIEILRELKNKEKINFARIGIQDSNIFQYTIEISVEKIKNIRQIVEASVEEYAKSSFKNFEMDYEIVQSNMKNITVLVFVSKKSTINNFVSVFDKAKIKLVSIEPIGNALVRALISDSKNYLVVDIGKKKTYLHFVKNGKKVFSDEINFGGDTITNSLKKELGVPFLEAENNKIKIGLKKSTESREIFDVLANNISALKEKINNTYVDWATSNSGPGFSNFKIENIIISGGTANMFGLKDYLATTLRIPVEIANPWVNLRTKDSFVPVMSYEESLSFAQVIGLSMAEK
jgi:type IV pilus assembly protein PilM